MHIIACNVDCILQNSKRECEMKRLFILLLVLVISINLTACNTEQIKGAVISQTDESMAQLDIMPQKLFEFANIGDAVIVTVGDFELEMVLVDKLIAEDGKLQLFYNADLHSLSICAYNQNLCEVYGVSINTKVIIAKNDLLYVITNTTG